MLNHMGYVSDNVVNRTFTEMTGFFNMVMKIKLFEHVIVSLVLMDMDKSVNICITTDDDRTIPDIIHLSQYSFEWLNPHILRLCVRFRLVD